MKAIFTITFILFSLTVISQEETLTNRTEFKDGVYFSYQDFASNTPALRLDQIRFERLEGGLPTQRYLYNFKPSPDINIDLDTVEIWGICLDGYPYINQSNLYDSYTQHTLVKDYYVFEQHAYQFSKIMIIGHLCHFTAEGLPTKGEPINDLLLEKEDIFPPRSNGMGVQYLLKVSTGELLKFTCYNLLSLIKDDNVLYVIYSGMSYRKKKKEMFYMFREYNKKHPIIL